MAGSVVASALTFCVGIGVLLAGQTSAGILLRHSASGIMLSYSVTPLSAWFLLVFSLIAVPVALYSGGLRFFSHGNS